MNDDILYRRAYDLRGRDFCNAGNASSGVKSILKEIGIDPWIVRRTAIAAYEAEMNVVMYAEKGIMEFMLDAEKIHLIITDKGPGIENIELAMQEGYSTASPELREMGFGAGMGLPNIRKNADNLDIQSKPNHGTQLTIKIFYGPDGSASRD